MAKKKSKKQEQPEQQDVIQEAGLSGNWAIADTPALNPAEPRPGSTPPSPNDMPPHFVGTLNPDMQHDKVFVGTEGRNPRVASTPLMPVAPSGNPQTNAAIRSVIKINQSASSSAAGIFNFRGVWNSFTTYNVNDVVLDNGSSYIALTGSVNLEPDQGNSTNWALLGKNLNFRGFWQAPPSIVRQTVGNGTNGGATFNVVMASVLAGSSMVVVVGSQNSGATAASVTDSQGNVYKKIEDSGHTISGGVSWSTLFLATNVKAGALTVTVSFTGSGGPGNDFAWASEVTTLLTSGQPDGVGTTELAANSGPLPSFTIAASRNSDIIFSGTGGSVTPLTVPTSWQGNTSAAYAIAWLQPALIGSNTVQWGGTFTISQGDFSSVGASFFTTSVPSFYNPFDVVEFNGSMWLCIAANNGSPSSAPPDWVLFAQSTGLAQIKTASYLAVSSDEGTLLSFNSASALTLTLPATPPDTGWWILVQNIGVGLLTVNPNGLQLDGVIASIPLGTNQGLLIFTNGTNYFTQRGASSPILAVEIAKFIA